MHSRETSSSWDVMSYVDISLVQLLYIKLGSSLIDFRIFFSLCCDQTKLWILIRKVGPLPVKAKRVCLLKYGNYLVMALGILVSKGQPWMSCLRCIDSRWAWIIPWSMVEAHAPIVQGIVVAHTRAVKQLCRLVAYRIQKAAEVVCFMVVWWLPSAISPKDSSEDYAWQARQIISLAGQWQAILSKTL